jgi:hypothetical protein
MSNTVEVSLRIPSLRVRRDGFDAAETIANGDRRFSRHLEVEGVPKTGEVLQVPVGADTTFPCEVVRSDWHEEKNMFVVACRYAKRSISPEEYDALMNAPDWQVRSLL